MKLRSFRFRIALLAAALAGGTLIGFGIVSWKLIYDAKISRLDANLENQLRRAGRPGPPNRWDFYATQVSRDLRTESTTQVALLVVGNEGAPFYRSGTWPARVQIPPLPQPPDLRFRPPSTPDNSPRVPPPDLPIRQFTASGWRVGTTRFPEFQVAIAVNLQSLDGEMGLIRTIFLVAIPGALLLIGTGAWMLSGSALAPIRDLTQTIRNVSVQGLDQRVAHHAVDLELVELIQVFNQMLERLERSFKQASRFSGDAAHELKTPLTILQGELEQALQQAELGSGLQQRLSSLLDEVRHLSGIVRKLLLLSLADAGQISLDRSRLNLSNLLTDLLEDLELLAPDLTVHAEILPGLEVQGDRDLLIQVLQNLLSNAIKYNLPGGWITLHTTRQARTLIVTISNASAEIPVGDRPRLFDRFHRGDPARTRTIEGTGLGLSLAREIARAHGGDLVLAAAERDQTTFRLSLPAAPTFRASG